MEGEAKRDALQTSAITGIAVDLEKLRPQSQEAISLTLHRANSSDVKVDSRHLPSFSDVRSRFSMAEAPTGSSEGRGPGVVCISPDALDGMPYIGNPQTATAEAGAIQNLANTLEKFDHVEPNAPSQSLRPALLCDTEDIDADKQQDDQTFQSVLAQTHIATETFTEESRRIESGQQASLALRPNVILLKLTPPPTSMPRFGTDGWLYSERDLVISRTLRHSDASGAKLSEEQYYQYVNIDPSTLDAHVRACYHVYFGEQVSVPRPSGRVVHDEADCQCPDEIDDQEFDPLACARRLAKRPFLPYSSWQTNSYANLNSKISSNDPFETTRSDPRTRFLVQFKCLQMKLLDHPEFCGVEPLFATAFVFSTGKNVGRRVSEMVHFDFNPEEMLTAALHPHLSGIDPLSRCTNMLFNLSKQSDRYFLVVIVERLYGSDDNSAYVSPGKFHKNPKARAELIERFKKNASKYGYLRRPFAWTAHQLFKHYESGGLQLAEGEIELSNFWTISNDAIKPFDLYSAISSKFSRSETKSELASFSLGHEMLKIEGKIAFSVHEWRSFCKTRIRSSTQTALAVTLFDSTRSGMSHSNPSVSISDSTHVVEVVELDSMARLSYSTFNNFVFVAPVAINLASYAKFGPFHVPSLMVSACLCERAVALNSLSSEQDSYSEGLQCCIGKSSVQSVVSCFAISHVAEFTKFSLFHDVMKMTLKPRIVPGTHILFTVYDVNTKSGGMFTKLTNTFFKGPAIGPLKQIVGYAFTSIDGGALNPPNGLELPLYQELPADYLNLSPASLEPYRILPTELPLQVSLTYQSTIQPKHPLLMEFFRDYSRFSHIMDSFSALKSRNTFLSIENTEKDLLLTTKQIEDSLSTLTRTPNEALHHYFPILCNQILCIISGSLQILSYETEILDKDCVDCKIAIIQKSDLRGDYTSEYTPLEESNFYKSMLYRQSLFAGADSGLGMWLTLADTALQSLAAIFSQIERHHMRHNSVSSASKVQLPGERSIMKRNYVEDVFDNLGNQYGLVGLYIVLAWEINLQSRSKSDVPLNDLEQHIGVLLDIVYKSYTLCFQSQLAGFPSDECLHALEHGPHIMQLIDSLMMILSQKYTKFRTSDPEMTSEVQMVKNAICELVIFIRDSARIFGSRCSFRFFRSILKHIYMLEDEVMRKVDFFFGSDFYHLRLEAVRIFIDSPYFVPMCRIDVLNRDACIDFDSALLECPFAALLLTQLDEVTAKGFNKECASLALAVMFHVLSSFDDNPRLQSAEVRMNIAVMFWPFVRICLRCVHNMIGHTLTSESWHYLLGCFMFVVGNLPLGFLSRWCALQSPRIISYFVQILHRAVKEFTIDSHMFGVRDGESYDSLSNLSLNDSPKSTFLIARVQSVNFISKQRNTPNEGSDSPHMIPVTTRRTGRNSIFNFEDSLKASRPSIQSQTVLLPDMSCIGEQLFETKIIDNVGAQTHFHTIQKHFSDKFSSQMILTVLASLHDVLEQFTSRVIGKRGRSFDSMREDIDVQRLEECVNDLFVTCLSRPYCRGGSTSQSVFTFQVNSKVWSTCLPLVTRCFQIWSTALPLQTKQWQEFAYHLSNLKNTSYNVDVVNDLEEILIRKYSSEESLPISMQVTEDNTDDKSHNVNIGVKSIGSSKILLYATAEKIIDVLVFREAEFSANFKEVFFCGFRNFITPMLLLRHLMGCVEKVIQEPGQNQIESSSGRSLSASSTTVPRVMNLLKYWITAYGSDWDEHLLADAHLFLERFNAQVQERKPIRSSADDAVVEDSGICVPKRLSVKPLSIPSVEENADEPIGAMSTSISSLERTNESPLLGSLKNAEVLQQATDTAANQRDEIETAFTLVGDAVASAVSHMSISKHSSPAKPATPVTSRTSASFYVSTFQVFARAMVKHLKSSNRFEPDSADGAFDSLPEKTARGTTTQRSAIGVFSFFRQNVDAGDLFLMTSPKHWAQCLTLHSFHIFRRFQTEEFFRAPFPAWQAKPESLRKQLVPNISENTDFFNLIKDFFVGCIFRNDSSYRKRALVHVIDIAYCMKQLNNFDGMFSAMSALDSVGIFRLKKTWQSITTPEHQAKLSDLRFLMESRNKYANYTEALRTAFPPKLPYIGHFLGSLFMQSERHPKTVLKNDVSLINFGRYYGLHDVVFNDILLHRGSPYSFFGEDDISKDVATDLLAFVKTPHPWLLSNEEEYERSHREEPCERVDCHICSVLRKNTSSAV